jgi:hypothetical protein
MGFVKWLKIIHSSGDGGALNDISPNPQHPLMMIVYFRNRPDGGESHARRRASCHCEPFVVRQRK